MCGIVGCILKEDNDVAPILFDCISKLEYRGYDSIGLATFADDNIHIKKDKGKIEEVDKKLDLSDMPGNFGIAHVRWATHGDPSKLNSHPHVDEDASIAVVHNGIIENYLEIKEKLTLEGHVFKSDTDTEVIPHLIQKFMDEKFDLEHAVRKTIDVIEGAYAIAAISKNEPDKTAYNIFNEFTNDGRDMKVYSELLSQSIESIINIKEENDIDSLFRSGGTTMLKNDIKGLEDFELISFMVVV